VPLIRTHQKRVLVIYSFGIYFSPLSNIMSQGDYIKFKKTGVQLQQSRLTPTTDDPSANRVFSHVSSYGQYDAFMGYSIETTTPNLSINYGKQTVPANVIQVFGMKLGNTASCPLYVCDRIPPPPPIEPPIPPDDDGDY